MKFYETHYEEYIQTSENYNIHPELSSLIRELPKNIGDFGNLIVYGPSGVGKYTQVLKMIQKYSPSRLKYDKKIKLQTDKQSYNYRISDIHYEIDMSLLGCNSKIIWHELFLQMVDIISMKPDKKGIIVCKNFHMIHTELLEIFYSYIQQYNHRQTNIQIRFILITEHVSFIPNNIIHCCKIISVQRPKKEDYIKMICQNQMNQIVNPMNENENHTNFIQRITQNKKNTTDSTKINKIMENIDPEAILNGKEMRSFSLLLNKKDLPSDIFETITNQLIQEMENPEKIVFTQFRDILYDILIYNLDVSECLYYVLQHFIQKGALKNKDISSILKKTHLFLKYYNNNYRPIYHLESMFFYIIIRLYYHQE
jgi:hypothetical protein